MTCVAEQRGSPRLDCASNVRVTGPGARSNRTSVFRQFLPRLGFLMFGGFGVLVAVNVGVKVGVGGSGVGVYVWVLVGVGVIVAVGVTDGVDVAVAVAVTVGVLVGVPGIGVAVGVAEGVNVGVGVLHIAWAANTACSAFTIELLATLPLTEE